MVDVALGQEVSAQQDNDPQDPSPNDLKPHQHRTFKVSQDPKFEEKTLDVVGLYLNPPEKAMVLSVDEKTQVQALERTQPMLPLKPGQAARHTRL